MTLPFPPGELEATYVPARKRKRSRVARRGPAPGSALTLMPASGGIQPIPGALPVDQVRETLTADGRMVYHRVLPARPARFASLADPLPDAIAHCLPAGGLWCHQSTAIDNVRDGRSVVIATGTASGKSLCYQLPIAESVVTGLRASTSLLVFPTKALAHDQLRALETLGVPGMRAATYDGDTDTEQRRWVRDNATVVLTNPEMLHHGILPRHRKWARFFKRLEYVVIDELHVLRGVFGTHVAHLLRRLQRAAALHDSRPTFVFTSATIGEPERLAGELSGVEITAIDDDGSPRGRRTVGLVQPAVVDTDRGKRQSPATEAVRLGAELVKAGRRTIVFCPSRAQTERVAAGIVDAVDPSLAGVIRPYRSGYLASERREIEEELASGRVRLVVATSALELGVDIGGLDATVLCGFPGTISSMWQQIGRAGRTSDESLAIVIAGDNQLDQWFVRHPDELFDRRPEPAIINTANPYVLDSHLGCAAFEHPLGPTDARWWPGLDDGIRRLVGAEELGLRSDQTRLPQAVWTGRGVPFARIGLRSAGGGEVAIVDSAGTSIGTVDKSRASSTVHTGAIYLHRGRSYRVREFDLDNRRAVVEPDESGRWTSTRSTVDIEVCEIGQRRSLGRSRVHFGTVRVTSAVTGYQEFGPGERPEDVGNLIELDVPAEELDTTAVWWEWDPEVVTAAGLKPFAVPGALHAAEHGAIGMLPLFAICDRWDVGGVSIASAPGTGLPTVFVYDGYAGGAGISDLAFTRAEELLTATTDLLERCACATGCPSCVQSPKCGNGNEPLDRWGALALLKVTLGDEDPF